MRHGTLSAGLFTLALVALLAWAAPAASAVLAEFSSPAPDDVQVLGFRLGSDQELHVSSTGFGYRSGGTRMAMSNAWILDASNRETVWNMYDARRDWKERDVTDEEYTVDLPAGDYEVYFSTYPQYHERKWSTGFSFNIWGHSVDKAVERVLDKEGLDDVDDLYRRFSLRVEGDGTAVDADAVRAAQDRMADDAIVSIRRLGDHEYVQKGFELGRKMKIHIYALGEAREDGVYDYGWILNADTGERVWMFTRDDSYHAGGADKNRVVDSVFEAPAGRYVAVFSTDDSHSYDRWNAAPPADPSFWGMTIRAEDPSETRYASAFEYSGRDLDNVIVEMIKVGDDDCERKGFTLKKPMDIRILCLGEGRDGEMYDYGWIVDARTRDRVWEMDYDETEHAGGGEKNRLFDKVVHFDEGDYIAYYATDDSHSYPHWNTEPPMDRERWGLTLVGADGYDPNAVTDYEEKGGDALARITEVRDDEFRTETFTLDKETPVQIYALGEGKDDRMYDYGWIEDAATGRVVWEMTYRKTRHAGGARKNRMFNDTIVLEPGKYKVFYETDGSHSFGDWNADRPYEPENWGIVVRRVNNS